jgi:hypothetical protein
VQDLETGAIIWAHDGYGDEVLKVFFESLTEEQCAGIEYVVADGARWITRQVEAFCPKAKRCVDPFHVVGWATEALDTVRKRLTTDTKKTVCPSEKPGESNGKSAGAVGISCEIKPDALRGLFGKGTLAVGIQTGQFQGVLPGARQMAEVGQKV